MPHTVSDVLVVLKPERARVLEEIEADMREQLAGLPGMTVLFTTPLGMRIDEGPWAVRRPTFPFGSSGPTSTSSRGSPSRPSAHSRRRWDRRSSGRAAHGIAPATNRGEPRGDGAGGAGAWRCDSSGADRPRGRGGFADLDRSAAVRSRGPPSGRSSGYVRCHSHALDRWP